MGTESCVDGLVQVVDEVEEGERVGGRERLAAEGVDGLAVRAGPVHHGRVPGRGQRPVEADQHGVREPGVLQPRRATAGAGPTASGRRRRLRCRAAPGPTRRAAGEVPPLRLGRQERVVPLAVGPAAQVHGRGRRGARLQLGEPVRVPRRPAAPAVRPTRARSAAARRPATPATAPPSLPRLGMAKSSRWNGLAFSTSRAGLQLVGGRLAGAVRHLAPRRLPPTAACTSAQKPAASSRWSWLGRVEQGIHQQVAEPDPGEQPDHLGRGVEQRPGVAGARRAASSRSPGRRRGPGSARTATAPARRHPGRPSRPAGTGAGRPGRRTRPRRRAGRGRRRRRPAAAGRAGRRTAGCQRAKYPFSQAAASSGFRLTGYEVGGRYGERRKASRS